MPVGTATQRPMKRTFHGRGGQCCPEAQRWFHCLRHFWMRLFFPLVGLFSVVWFLVRVVPKPSRAAYPCQRAAFPLASSFVLWLVGLAGSIAMFRKARRYFVHARLVAAVMCLGLSVGIVWLLLDPVQRPAAAMDVPLPNLPLGVARGVQPGRVVWIHDPNATDWDGYNSTQPWYDDAHTDPAVVQKMVSRAIRGLAGESTEARAWDKLLRYFNQVRGKGDVGYVAGEKVAIKINNTLCYNASTTTFEKRSENRNRIDNSPQMIAALLGQLVNVVGVAQQDISIGDPGRIMPGFIYNRVHPQFPDVCYLASNGGLGRTAAEFSSVPLYWSTPASAGKRQDFLPKSFAEADYFINFAILKSHDQGGITLCGKNLYGSLIRNPDTTLQGTRYNYYDMHTSLPRNTPGTGKYRALVDLMGHPQLGGKTLLYMVDGLFAGRNWSSDPMKWKTPPFGGDWPSSVFVSQDPVAIDSVCSDFLWIEWSDLPHMSGADDYLVEAAMADKPPSGTFYDPNRDGVGLASLGVHEHWNNLLDKKYSRNLGAGEGIELTCPGATDFDGDSEVGFDDLAAFCSDWLMVSGTSPADLSGPVGDGVVNLRDFAVLARHWTVRR